MTASIGCNIFYTEKTETFCCLTKSSCSMMLYCILQLNRSKQETFDNLTRKSCSVMLLKLRWYVPCLFWMVFERCLRICMAGFGFSYTFWLMSVSVARIVRRLLTTMCNVRIKTLMADQWYTDKYSRTI